MSAMSSELGSSAAPVKSVMVRDVASARAPAFTEN